MNDTLKATLRTFLQAVVGLFIVFITGLGGTIASWLGVKLPGYEPQVKLAVSALIAVVIAAVTFGMNWIQNKLHLGETAEYTPAGTPLPPPPPQPQG